LRDDDHAIVVGNDISNHLKLTWNFLP
jgi:hypothetical protein